ncbi:MAG: carboxypeptidase-like regulatory domain-containing protein [Terriglobales bacterium]
MRRQPRQGKRERISRTGVALLASVVGAALLLPLAAQTKLAAPTAAQVLFLAAATAPPVARGQGQLLGYVVDAQGHPQADALVEVRAAGLGKAPLRVRTGAHGLFHVLHLSPGVYYIEAGKGSSIAARQKVQVRASERALLLFNLPEMLLAARFGPPVGVAPDQAFRWALRQAALWRPILHYEDPGALSIASASAPVEGYVALTAGSGDSAFAAPLLATRFQVDALELGSERVSVSGIVGTNGDLGGADTEVSARMQSADASDAARMSISVRQLAIPARSALPDLRLFSFNYANAIGLSPHVRVQYGAMIHAVSLTDTVTTFDPYVRMVAQVSPEAELEYRAVSGVPPLHFGAESVNLDDPMPRVTVDQGQARLERARHQEIRYTASLTSSDSFSAAVFEDRYTRTAINGAFTLSGAAASLGDIEADSALLPDLTSNMFLADGGNYGGWGYRLGVQHRMGANWRAIVGYSQGAVLAPDAARLSAGPGSALAAELVSASAHALTFKLAGVTPLTHTQLVCSYRALNRLAATGLDLYDDSFTQSRSYANVFLRQPLPGFMSGGGKLAALIEIHNLLAQGYIPVLAPDGQTLYLVQSARSLRGGLTLSF